ncbi:AbrB/MazE/SpoVT family DNA-binding domain-containing protein [Phyllobacterium sp. SB3]|uniref:AbrB/MazE/SpoVT family DNA-binding domain-containing protein n=1 Tax=Phyllobacterium sp. SB3 TaxID=3156073 RepID=UPI0032AE940E
MQIKKWGNSASVRIPAKIMAAASLHLEQEVEVSTDDQGRVIIAPVQTPVYQLDEMLNQMSAETFPEEADFGPAVGKEIW